ncbi:MAG: hypothetical protein WC815_05580 [Vicinamibacterales bacterium]|jgi:hypothetical protein
MIKLFRILILCGFSAVTGCERSVEQEVGSQDSHLFVPEDATDVKLGNRGSSVAFRVKESYPGERFRLALDNQYHPPTWVKLDELVLFPGRRSSEFTGGWAEYVEGANVVRMWAGNWKNEDGAVVTYVVRYRSKDGGPVDPQAVAEVEGLFARSPR